MKKGDNKLEDLPEYIKTDLHILILMNNGGHKIKSLLEKKYEKDDKMIICNRKVYDAYIAAHKDEIEKDENLKKKMMEISKESFDNISELKDVIDTGNDSKVRDQLDKIREFCLQRIQFIMEQQQRGFASPQYENVFVNYLKVLQTLLDKTIQYRNEIEQDKDEITKNILFTLVDKIVIATEYSYKELHGDKMFTEFMNLIQEKLEGAVDQTLKEHGYDQT